MHSLAKGSDLELVQHRLRQVQAEDVGRWGVMTAAQMVCHLGGAFRMAMGELPCEPSAMPLPQFILKRLALWAPFRWKRNLPTIAELKIGTPAMKTSDFERDRQEALATMDRFLQPGQMRGDHAFFGPMSYADWMRLGYLHTDHHLRQFDR